MDPVGRFFLCARCRQHTIICSPCDRGHIYCSRECAQSVRTASVLAAGRRYQRSEHGRANHAQRMRRYRAKQTKVTHQGSLPASWEGSPLRDSASAVPAKPRVPAPTISPPWHCQSCGCTCSEFMRRGFLRPRSSPQRARLSLRSADTHGRSP